MSRKLSEKDMEVHREYMKKYKKDSSALQQEKMRYHDHYEVLGISREATHTEVIIVTATTGGLSERLSPDARAERRNG